MTSGSSQTSRTVNHPVRLAIRTSKTRQDAVASLLALKAVELILKISQSHRSARAGIGTVKRSAHVVQIAMAGTIEIHSTTRSRRGGPSPLCSMSLPSRVSCRWVFFEKVEIAPGVFDQFSLIAVNRIPAVQSIFQSVTDGFRCCFNLVQQFDGVFYGVCQRQHPTPLALAANAYMLSC
jgi:hypothetical protein